MKQSSMSTEYKELYEYHSATIKKFIKLNNLIDNSYIESRESILSEIFDYTPTESPFTNSLWKVLFTGQYIIALKSLDLQDALTYTKLISEGFFGQSVEIMSNENMRCCTYFQTKFKDILILFRVNIVKKPITEQQNLIGFKYEHKLLFLDIGKSTSLFSIPLIESSRLKNPYTSDYSIYIRNHAQILIPQENSKYQTMMLFKFLDEQGSDFWPHLEFKVMNQAIRWHPLILPDTNVNKANYLLINNYYLSKEELNIFKFRANIQKVIQNNAVIMKQIRQPDLIKLFMGILSQKDHYNLNLNNQERDLILSEENLMVIGRSGTGKTTCAIIRLLIQQLQFLYSSQSNQDICFRDIGSQSKVFKCVFTTLSRQLAGQVGQMYVNYIITLNQHLQQHYQTDLTIKNILSQLALQYELLYNENTIENHLFDSNEPMHSIQDFSSQDFPMFLNLKQLLCYLDNSFTRPFFRQPKFQNIQSHDKIAQWNNGNQVRIIQNFDCTVQQSLNQRQKQSIIIIDEVDYQVFRDEFWMCQHFDHKIQNDQSFCNLVWTQIYSYIKGSEVSYKYPKLYLPYLIYQEQQCQNIPEEQIAVIYNYFLLYETWKEKHNYFDRLDLTNYLLNQLEQGQYQGPLIHCLYVDEVQDLPNAMLKLLMKLTEQQIYLSGDTAQNIVKGIGFRFQDLRSIIQQQKTFSNITSKQLTVNFRTHNNILQFANSIISLLDIFFPKTIDKLCKEYSDIIGPKVMIAPNLDAINRILTQQDDNNQYIQFGVSQIVLVKNDSVKEQVPKQLEDAIILTILESKGLEFDDVVVYNFFTDQPIPQKQWDLLKLIIVKEQEIDRQVFEASISRHNQEEIQDSHEFVGLKTKEGKVIKQKLSVAQQYKQSDNLQFSLLCSELKLLYVAITRARKRVIIYDDMPENRAILQMIWRELNLVDFVKDHNITQQVQTLAGLTETKKKEWRRQGIRLFQLKFFEQAAKCFKYAQDENLTFASLGYQLASSSQKHLSDNQRFVQAGQFFVKAQLFEQAGQCYFSSENYSQALIYFLNAQSYNLAITCSIKLQYYILATILYLKLNQIDSALMMSLQLQSSTLSYQIMVQYFDKLSPNIIQQYISERYKRYLDESYVLYCQDLLNEQILASLCISKLNKKELKTQLNVHYRQQIQQIKYLRDYQQDFISEIQTLYQSNLKYGNMQGYITSMKGFFQLYRQFIQQELQSRQIIHIQTVYSKYFQNDQTSIEILEILIYYNLLHIQLAVQFELTKQIENPLYIFLQQLYSVKMLQSENQAKKFNFQSVYDLFRQLIQFEKAIDQHLFFGLIQLGELKLIQSISIQYYVDYPQSILQNQMRESIKGILKASQIYNEYAVYSNDEIEEKIYLLYHSYQLRIQRKYKPLLTIDQVKNLLNQIDFFDEKSVKQQNLQYTNLVMELYYLLIQCFKSQEQLFISLDQNSFQILVKYIWIVANIFKHNLKNNLQKIIFDAICSLYNIQFADNQLFKVFNLTFCFIHKDSELIKFGLQDLKLYQLDNSIYQARSDSLIEIIQVLFEKFLNNYLHNYIQKKYSDNIKQYILEQFNIVISQKYTSIKNQYEYENVLKLLLPQLLYQPTISELEINEQLQNYFRDLALGQFLQIIKCTEPSETHTILIETCLLFSLLNEENKKVGLYRLKCLIKVVEESLTVNISKKELKSYFNYMNYLHLSQQALSIQACQYYLLFVADCQTCNVQQILRDININVLNLTVSYIFITIIDQKEKDKFNTLNQQNLQQEQIQQLITQQWIIQFLESDIMIPQDIIKILSEKKEDFSLQLTNIQDIMDQLERLITYIFTMYAKKYLTFEHLVRQIIWISTNIKDTVQIGKLLYEEKRIIYSNKDKLNSLIELVELKFNKRKIVFENSERFPLLAKELQQFSKYPMKIKSVKGDLKIFNVDIKVIKASDKDELIS